MKLTETAQITSQETDQCMAHLNCLQTIYTNANKCNQVRGFESSHTRIYLRYCRERLTDIKEINMRQITKTKEVVLEHSDSVSVELGAGS